MNETTQKYIVDKLDKLDTALSGKEGITERMVRVEEKLKHIHQPPCPALAQMQEDQKNSKTRLFAIFMVIFGAIISLIVAVTKASWLK